MRRQLVLAIAALGCFSLTTPVSEGRDQNLNRPAMRSFLHGTSLQATGLISGSQVAPSPQQETGAIFIELVIDTSGTVRSTWDSIVDTVEYLVAQLPAGTRIRLILYDTEVRLNERVYATGQDERELVDSLRTVDPKGEYTSSRTALSVAKRLGAQDKLPHERLFIVMLTDGVVEEAGREDKKTEEIKPVAIQLFWGESTVKCALLLYKQAPDLPKKEQPMPNLTIYRYDFSSIEFDLAEVALDIIGPTQAEPSQTQETPPQPEEERSIWSWLLVAGLAIATVIIGYALWLFMKAKMKKKGKVLLKAEDEIMVLITQIDHKANPVQIPFKLKERQTYSIGSRPEDDLLLHSQRIGDLELGHLMISELIPSLQPAASLVEDPGIFVDGQLVGDPEKYYPVMEFIHIPDLTQIKIAVFDSKKEQ